MTPSLSPQVNVLTYVMAAWATTFNSWVNYSVGSTRVNWRWPSTEDFMWQRVRDAISLNPWMGGAAHVRCACRQQFFLCICKQIDNNHEASLLFELPGLGDTHLKSVSTVLFPFLSVHINTLPTSGQTWELHPFSTSCASHLRSGSLRTRGFC